MKKGHSPRSIAGLVAYEVIAVSHKGHIINHPLNSVWIWRFKIGFCISHFFVHTRRI